MTQHDISHLAAVLFALFATATTLGLLAQRIGQPSVVGELIAGILLGGSVLGILNPADPVIHSLAQLGVMVLLFEIGLHTDVRGLLNVGGSALAVAVVGVALPFALGYGVCAALGLSTIPSIVAGAALTATSIGISARTLSDLGQLNTREGQIVLGAAVIDDVIGLIILSVVAGIVGGASVGIGAIALTTGVAVGFIAAALILGSLIIPPFFRFIDRVEQTGILGIAGLAFAFLLAWLATVAGSATIIGAFAAGLILHRTPQRERIEAATTAIGHFFTPIFFAAVGAAVDLGIFRDPRAVAIGAALLAVGVIGKVAAGYAPFWIRARKFLIGVAMIPRGEVGLIFAQMGLASAALTPRLFSAVAFMVLATTLITPPLLGYLVRSERRPTDSADRPGDGGIDDLVSGSFQRAVTPPLPAVEASADTSTSRGSHHP
ncbi:MAG TPA: cation:proton antiporter [Gemmatimonadaceae bacterium]|nr:cation:proton antiporter [Gemmatimonadaceae bacterium]